MTDADRDKKKIDQCARAIEEALEAMNPPLAVHGGILRLIAEYAMCRPPYSECPYCFETTSGFLGWQLRTFRLS